MAPESGRNSLKHLVWSAESEALILHEAAFEELSFEKIRDAINWRQNEIRVFGKMYPEPRLTAWFGPPYKYSSISWPEEPMPGFIREICFEVEKLTDSELNSVLINYYRDGRDSMGWHRDNEPEMDTSVIASLSLGETRRISFRERKGIERIHIDLPHGSLLVMKNMQSRWEHAIPKTSRDLKGRINMTFRRIILSDQ